MSAPIEKLRKALSTMHARACGDDSKVYMSIPARPNEDADLLLSAALDELEELRKGDRDAFGAGFRRGLAEGAPGVDL